MSPGLIGRWSHFSETFLVLFQCKEKHCRVDMLSSARSISARCASSQRRASKVSRKAYSSVSLPELVKRPATSSKGILGLDIRGPKDVEAMTKQVLEECDAKVELLSRYEDFSPSEVRAFPKPRFPRFKWYKHLSIPYKFL